MYSDDMTEQEEAWLREELRYLRERNPDIYKCILADIREQWFAEQARRHRSQDNA